ncbi:glycosyltransferase family 9 protein [Candidatus Nitrosacidococcus sp. I8]|uniref:glycosyltransferase family 9 protein n=1 Tax=Candidatus Nitrosacidococcus sp. I8 TaxID=2942908 RepID=UPI002227743E|nr:glycosyltransferase family 9 protein [Candidatus Nitrosacidococcus sp. I8]CAH9019253.1 Lipopolysaccharide core heptosyltransferase RfaQ [Candidatus Nitrosacidococcus sp. I8]
MHRILIITLSNIGDAIMTTPVLETLYQQFPEAKVDIVADRRSSEIFQYCPYIDGIFHKNKNEGWQGVIRLIRQLRTTRYDLIVDLRTDGLSYLLRAKKRLTKQKTNVETTHSVIRHRSALDPILPKEFPIPPCSIWIPESYLKEAKQILAVIPNQRMLAIGLGANWPPKIWPALEFLNLISLIKDNFDSIVLVGSQNDRVYSQQVIPTLPLPYLNLCGQTNLLQVAAILKQAQIFIGNDSGLGHLAAAVGTPTFTVFGPGNPDRYHPWGLYNYWQVASDQNLQNLKAADIKNQVLDLIQLTFQRK